MRKTIVKLEQDPSKQQEIDFLNEVAESIPDGAYLKGLFTEKFVNFIAQKIRDDWYCDFMDMYQAEIDRADDAGAELRAFQKDFEGYTTKTNREIEGLSKKIETLSLLAQSKSDIIDQMVEARWEKEREHNNEKQEWRDEFNKVANQLDSSEKKREELSIENIKLKAKLYDMQDRMAWLEEHFDYDSVQED